MNAIECGTCGKTIVADAPSGLCPACLLRTAIEHGSSRALAPFLPKLRYFGDYELLEEIARGGMGVAYRARQVSPDRTVALKMMRPGLLSTETEIRRFLSEARTAASLRHPHIVAIHEAGEFDGLHYFSMDYVEGPNLAAIVREGRWRQPRPRYVQILAETVHFAHGKGILHRDLKPSNVLVDGAGRPSITDFGLARRMRSDETGAGSGAVIGTPAYMAPEQASGDGTQVTAAGDVYSLGAILYELLTGRPPFRAASLREIVRLVLDTEPQRPRSLNPAVDARIEAICLRCLAKDPAARFASAGELADDLKRYLAGDSVHSRRRRSLWPELAAAAVVAIAVLSFLALRTERRILVARQAAAIPIPVAKAPAPTIEVPAPKPTPKPRPAEAKPIPPPTAIAASVSPETGSGYKQIFSFRYPFAEHEFDALCGVEVDFGGSSEADQRHCNILFEPSAGRVQLQYNPVGGTGLRLAVTFQPSFDGVRKIRSWVLKTPGAQRSETTVAGQWTVGMNSKQ